MQIYESRLKPTLEPKYNGMFVAIDVESGDYALGAGAVEASDKLRQTHADRDCYIARVGAPTTFRMG